MKGLYLACIFILTNFCAALAQSEQTKNIPIKLSNLSQYFEASTLPSSVINSSIFYNQSHEKRSFENFDRRFIIVHFWASWCMECKRELSALNKLQKDFRKKALLVLAISEDFKPVKDIDDFYAKNKIDYLDIYIDKKRHIYETLNINHLPASFLFDIDGNLIAQSKPRNEVDWQDEDLLKFINENIAKIPLLPPEYKLERDKFEAPKEEVKKTISKTQTTNNQKKIFIN